MENFNSNEVTMENSVKSKNRIEGITTKYKQIKIIAIVALCLFATSALFCSVIYSAWDEMHNTSYAWPVVSATNYVVGMILSLVLFIFLTVTVVQQFIKLNKNKDWANELPKIILNLIMVVLLFIFLIIGLTKSVLLFTFNSTYSKDHNKIYKFCAELGIISAIVVYILQYANIHLNKKYKDASETVKMNRCVSLTVGSLAIGAMIFTPFWAGFAFQELLQNKLAGIFILKYITGLIGAESLLFIWLAGYKIFSHFAIEDNENYFRDISIFLIVAILMFVLFVILAVKVSVGHIRAENYPTTTSFIAFHFVVEALSLAAGIVTLVLAKDQTKQPAKAE